jgi:hypothetical protein
MTCLVAAPDTSAVRRPPDLSALTTSGPDMGDVAGDTLNDSPKHLDWTGSIDHMHGGLTPPAPSAMSPMASLSGPPRAFSSIDFEGAFTSGKKIAAEQPANLPAGSLAFAKPPSMSGLPK